MMTMLDNLPLGPDGLVPPSPNLMMPDLQTVNACLAKMGRFPSYYPWRVRNPLILADFLDCASLMSGLPVEARYWLFVCPQCRQPLQVSAELLLDPPADNLAPGALVCGGRLGDARCGFTFIRYREAAWLSSPTGSSPSKMSVPSQTAFPAVTSPRSIGPRSVLSSVASWSARRIGALMPPLRSSRR